VPILAPDAGPLITLAYADRLDLLQRPGWPVDAVDMVLHEVTRNQTPTSEVIAAFVKEHALTAYHLSVCFQTWKRRP